MPLDSSRSRLPPAAPERRRRRLLVALAAPTLAALPFPASGGAQVYEPLADAVRIAFIDWLNEMSGRLLRTKPDYRERIEFLRTLDYEAVRAGLDRQLVLALIQVESNFRKYAVSSAGARGYMQVMPFWTGVIGDGDVRKLFDMRANLRYGCVILRHYLDVERGDLFLALGRYNGSRGREAYPNAVLAAWQARWAYAARRPATS